MLYIDFIFLFVVHVEEVTLFPFSVYHVQRNEAGLKVSLAFTLLGV